MKELKYSATVKKQIQKFSPEIKRRLKKKLEVLSAEKAFGIFLRTPLQNYQKLRVGSYRIIFQEKPENTFFIVYIEHRSKVYENFMGQ